MASQLSAGLTGQDAEEIITSKGTKWNEEKSKMLAKLEWEVLAVDTEWFTLQTTGLFRPGTRGKDLSTAFHTVRTTIATQKSKLNRDFELLF